MGLFKEKPRERNSTREPLTIVADEPPDEERKAAPAPKGPAPNYGIQQAIELMRSLPADLQTTDIVVQVVKRTLESARIDVSTIIADATRKEEQIETRVRSLQQEIASYQREIETRSKEIETLQVDLEETSRVKERLVLAEKLTT